MSSGPVHDGANALYGRCLKNNSIVVLTALSMTYAMLMMSTVNAQGPRKGQFKEIARMALAEDLGPGDVTSAIFSPKESGIGQFLAKQDGVLSGTELVKSVFSQLAPSSRVKFARKDGDSFRAGEILGEVSGPLRALFSGERVALNFLQQLSGVATMTSEYVSALGPKTRIGIYDTRKTTPLLRLPEKEAVVHGGGRNHRFGLFDMAMLKNNHIDAAGGINAAVTRLNKNGFFFRKPRLILCIEARTADEALAATAAGADIVMLDNMRPAQLRRCVTKICGESKRLGLPRPSIEISGGITPAKLPALRNLPIDRISVGAVTHSASAIDISFRIVPMREKSKRLFVH